MMQAMDIFVLPSTLIEGLPLTVAEAHASMLPVVATDVGGTKEIVINLETGLLIPPRNTEALAKALKFLIDDPGEAERMARAGRKRCEERFSSLVMIKSVEALYERCAR